MQLHGQLRNICALTGLSPTSAENLFNELLSCIFHLPCSCFFQLTNNKTSNHQKWNSRLSLLSSVAHLISSHLLLNLCTFNSIVAALVSQFFASHCSILTPVLSTLWAKSSLLPEKSCCLGFGQHGNLSLSLWINFSIPTPRLLPSHLLLY